MDEDSWIFERSGYKILIIVIYLNLSFCDLNIQKMIRNIVLNFRIKIFNNNI